MTDYLVVRPRNGKRTHAARRTWGGCWGVALGGCGAWMLDIPGGAKVLANAEVTCLRCLSELERRKGDGKDDGA